MFKINRLRPRHWKLFQCNHVGLNPVNPENPVILSPNEPSPLAVSRFANPIDRREEPWQRLGVLALQPLDEFLSHRAA